ncbi:MAG: translation initiation factor IF-2 [Candidatus Gracilibacteria bacterium]|nr:translation initiation factor IF-2 [Candidatus Gracilibacteria bacterium]
MSKPNVVDDYYSNINSSSSDGSDDSSKQGIKGKIKVKIKSNEKENETQEIQKKEFINKKEKKSKENKPSPISFQSKKDSGFNENKKIFIKKGDINEKKNFVKQNNEDQEKVSSAPLKFRKKEEVEISGNSPKQGGFVKKDYSKKENFNKNPKSENNFKNDGVKNYTKSDTKKTEPKNKDSFDFIGENDVEDIIIPEIDLALKPTYSFKKKEDVKIDTKKKWSEDGVAGKKPFFKDGKSKHKNKSFFEEEDTSFSRSKKIKDAVKKEKNIEEITQNLVDKTGETIIIPDILNLKEFSEKIGVPLAKLMGEFMKNGMMVNLNSKIDFETASIIADAFSIKLERDISAGFAVEDILEGDITNLLKEDNPEKLQKRAPVVSIMGHVDHGKTSLLDYIRKTKVAAKEAGGITQSIGAYQVEENGERITFLDTPGHEAFTVMRARGAKSTDIAILVVAADEGVKPQTIESISHAKEAGIPIIVAINKMDKEGANIEKVKAELSEHGIISEDWGGTNIMCPVSAKTGEGIEYLLEMVLLVAEMADFKANPDRFAVGTVLESHLDINLGPVASVLINTGTINVGDAIVCKSSFGKLRTLKDFTSKNIKSAGPGAPVLVIGFDKVVEGGDIVQVVSDIDTARKKALEYDIIMANKKSKQSSSIDMIMSRIKSGSLKQLKIVVKADTNGSLEAIKGALSKLTTEETKVSIIHSGVGNITEGDSVMCSGGSAILIGFNVGLVGSAKNVIEKEKVEYINSKIIYHITDRIEKIVTGMLDPKEVEVILGEAIVKAIFFDDKKFMIVGLGLKAENNIEDKAMIRVIRDKKMIGKGKIESLKQGVEEVKMLEGPIECGIKFAGDIKLEEKDILEIYKIEIHR